MFRPGEVRSQCFEDRDFGPEEQAHDPRLQVSQDPSQTMSRTYQMKRKLWVRVLVVAGLEILEVELRGEDVVVRLGLWEKWFGS